MGIGVLEILIIVVIILVLFAATSGYLVALGRPPGRALRKGGEAKQIAGQVQDKAGSVDTKKIGESVGKGLREARDVRDTVKGIATDEPAPAPAEPAAKPAAGSLRRSPPRSARRRARAQPVWAQYEFALDPRPRGFHLVTREVVSNLPERFERIEAGLLHLHILHLRLARAERERERRRPHRPRVLVQRRRSRGRALLAPHVRGAGRHARSRQVGPDRPVADAPGRGRRPQARHLAGIYLCEHRDHGGGRRIVATLNGD